MEWLEMNKLPLIKECKVPLSAGVDYHEWKTKQNCSWSETWDKPLRSLTCDLNDRLKIGISGYESELHGTFLYWCKIYGMWTVEHWTVVHHTMKKLNMKLILFNE